MVQINAESDFLVDQDQGVFTIRPGVVDELDMTHSQQVFDAVVEAAGDTACRAVVFDLARATFLDCATAGALVRARDEVQKQDKPFVLDMCGANPIVTRLIDMIDLEDRLVIAR